MDFWTHVQDIASEQKDECRSFRNGEGEFTIEHCAREETTIFWASDTRKGKTK